jgi:hypothetical protein
MHPLIDEKTVAAIRTTGGTSTDLPDRVGILDTYGLPYDQPAENVIISGCQVLPLLPQVLQSLARLFDRKGLSYTFLSTEYCCGNYLYRPAIKARDQEALADCRELSKEFAAMNLEQAKKLGANRTVIFCSPCYPVYKHAFPEESIVFYPAAIAEVMEEMDLPGEIDYYAGCYRLHRKFSPVPMDLDSTDEVFAKMKGLDVHRISAPKCCFDPEGLAHMIDNVQTRRMVHICTGCYGQAQQNVPADKGTEILMLPEFVERALGG